MAVAQRRQPEAAVAARVLGVAHAHLRRIQQLHHQREHLLARQTGTLEVAAHGGAQPVRAPCRSCACASACDRRARCSRPRGSDTVCGRAHRVPSPADGRADSCRSRRLHRPAESRASRCARACARRECARPDGADVAEARRAYFRPRVVRDAEPHATDAARLITDVDETSGNWRHATRLKRRSTGCCRWIFPGAAPHDGKAAEAAASMQRLVRHSADSAPAATKARSLMFTFPRSNFFAAAAMRSSACAIGITGFLSPAFILWKRTGLIRATT